MPPPDPRSRTTSPGWSFARAVGLPQPSEASTADSGIWHVWSSLYRLPVIGSVLAAEEGEAPQQAFPLPWTTRRAASPYFCLTASVIVGVVICLFLFALCSP